MTGRATLAAGAPWAEAEVVLLSRLLPDAPQSPADRVTARTDERGRFRARVLPFRTYTVWARQRVAAGWRTSTVAESVVAGDRVRLRARPALGQALGLEVSKLEPWGDLAPFTVAIRSQTQNVAYRELPVVANTGGPHTASCPPFPGEHVTVELLGKGRVPLGRWNTGAASTGGLQPAKPVERGFEIRAIESRQGVARVGVHVGTLDGGSTLLARSEEDGYGTLRLPRGFGGTLFTVDEIDHALNGGQLQRGPFPNSEPARAGKAVHYHATLEHMSHARARFLLDGKPVPGLFVAARTQLRHALAPMHLSVQTRSTLLRTSPRGEIAVEVPRREANEFLVPLLLALDATTIGALGYGELGLSHVVWNPCRPKTKAATFELRSLRPIEVCVDKPDASPASRTSIVFSDLESFAMWKRKEHADRRGRWRGLLPVARRLHVSAVAPSGVCFFTLEVAPRANAELVTVRLPLQAMREISGRVVDAAGKPVVDTKVFLDYRQRFRPVPAWEAEPFEKDGVRVRPTDLKKFSHAAYNAGAFDDIVATTDSEGRFVLRQPPFSGQWTVNVLRDRAKALRQALPDRIEGELVLRVK